MHFTVYRKSFVSKVLDGLNIVDGAHLYATVDSSMQPTVIQEPADLLRDALLIPTA